MDFTGVIFAGVVGIAAFALAWVLRGWREEIRRELSDLRGQISGRRSYQDMEQLENAMAGFARLLKEYEILGEYIENAQRHLSRVRNGDE